MRNDASVGNGDPATPGWTAVHVVQMLQAACPNTWQKVLRNRLGSTDPANLTRAELADFTEHVFWLVKQNGIRDPAAFLAFQVQLEAKAAPAKLGSSRKIGEIPAQSKSAGLTSAASPPRPVARTIGGTTKGEVLSRIKAAIEAGESLRHIAEWLAFAHERFHASQRDVARAVGRSASWVNHLLKWHRSGYKQSSPFGPTTRAGRAAYRQLASPNNIGTAPTGLHRETSSPDIRKSGDDGNVGLVPHCSPQRQHQQAAPPAFANKIHLSGSKQIEPMASVAAANREIKASKTETAALGDPARQPGRNDSRQPEKQKPPEENSRASQKLSPERMRIVLDALKEYPILARAAAKAGIHRKTLAYWLKCSMAGHAGYDLEWEGVEWRFHEHCDSAIAEAHDTLHFLVWQNAMGIKFKIDPLLEKLGHRGVDAYAKDANGDFIEEGVRQPNLKMMRFYLAWKRPERWGKPREAEITQRDGVLVIGERTEQPKNSSTASIKARKWKAVFRKA